MEAHVKATGKVVEIVGEGIQNSNMVMAAHGEWFTKDELDIVPLSWKPFEPTYWQKLEHTYAGMFMKSFLNNFDGTATIDELADIAIDIAHTLVEKYKKEERK